MVSTLAKPVQSVLLTLSLPTSAIEQAIQFLKLSNLSADQQITIETAIGHIAKHRNCSRQQAAWWLHRRAFPTLF